MNFIIRALFVLAFCVTQANAQYLTTTGGGSAPTGSAGGSLKGTYPNPGLADINTIATSLAIGGCTISTDALCFSGTATGSGRLTIGGITNTANGAASVSNSLWNGTVFTGGTATTNFPAMFVQPTGTSAVTSWSTAGTGLGMNLANGFAGNFLDFHVAGGANVFNVNSTGAIFSGAITSNSFIQIGGGSVLTWSGKSQLSSPVNAQFLFTDNAATNSFILTATTATATPTVQLGAAAVASGAVAQTLTFQGNTASTTNGPLALIQGAGGGSSTSVGGELRLSGGLSSAAAGTGGAVTIYTAPAATGNAAALVATFAANKATTLAGTLTVSGITNVATTSALCYNTGTGLITYDGTLGTCTVSDERLKNMGERIPNSLDRLLQISGVYYTWKDASLGSGRQIGVGAQTVEKVFPELVQTDINGRKSADYQRLTAPIIEALRELKVDNDNLRLEMNELKRASR